jgi:hypothetical protein
LVHAFGRVEDAEWEALSMNAAHGLRRTNADKRRVVLRAVVSPAAAEASNYAIADHCGVSFAMVAQVRRQLGIAPTRIVSRDGRVRRPSRHAAKAAGEAETTSLAVSRAQLQWLAQVFRVHRSGGDLSVLLRSPEAARLEKKVLHKIVNGAGA